MLSRYTFHNLNTDEHIPVADSDEGNDSTTFFTIDKRYKLRMQDPYALYNGEALTWFCRINQTWNEDAAHLGLNLRELNNLEMVEMLAKSNP